MRNRSIIENAFGIGSTQGFESYSKFFEFLERSSPSEYDKIMDAVYADTNIGGGMHRTFDGTHTIFGSYEAIKDSTGEVEAVEFFKAHFNELVTPEGIPIFTLDKAQYTNVCHEISESLDGSISPGQIGNFIRDSNSLNAGEIASVSLGSIFLLMAFKSQSSVAISRSVALNLCLGLGTGNPLQSLLGLSALAVGYRQGKIRAWEILKGATPPASGLIAYQGARHLLDLSKSQSVVVSILTGVAVSALIEHLDVRAQEKVRVDLGNNDSYVRALTPILLTKAISVYGVNQNRLASGI